MPLTLVDLNALSDAVADRRAERFKADVEMLSDRPAPAGRLGISGRGLGGAVTRPELVPGSWSGGRRRRDWNQIRKVSAGHQGLLGRDIRGVVRSRFEGTV